MIKEIYISFLWYNYCGGYMDKKKKSAKKNKADKELLFETSTVMNKEEFKRYQKFYLNKFKSNIVPKLVLIGLALLSIVLNYMKGNYGIALSIVGFVIAYPIFLNITINLQINRMFLNHIRINLLEERLVFYKDYLESKSSSNWCKVKYEDIFKVCETKKNFYIFVNDNQAFIIIKDNLKDIDAFRDFIRDKGIYKRYR